MWKILKDIAKKNKRQLFLTFLLVAMENLMAILYPLFAGFAINAVVKGDVLHALSYAVVVFVMWTIGMLRRRVDTRVFTKIYAEMAVPMIINQRNKGNDASAVAARVALSREFVDFFELHLPIFITSLVSIVGALVMLLFLEMQSVQQVTRVPTIMVQIHIHLTLQVLQKHRPEKTIHVDTMTIHRLQPMQQLQQLRQLFVRLIQITGGMDTMPSVSHSV